MGVKSGDELTELKDYLRRQEVQLDNILKHLSSGPAVAAPNGRQSYSSRRYWFAPDGQPICLRCDQASHIARDCSVGAGNRRSVKQVRVDLGQGVPVFLLAFLLVDIRETNIC